MKYKIVREVDIVFAIMVDLATMIDEIQKLES